MHALAPCRRVHRGVCGCPAFAVQGTRPQGPARRGTSRRRAHRDRQAQPLHAGCTPLLNAAAGRAVGLPWLRVSTRIAQCVTSSLRINQRQRASTSNNPAFPLPIRRRRSIRAAPRPGDCADALRQRWVCPAPAWRPLLAHLPLRAGAACARRSHGRHNPPRQFVNGALLWPLELRAVLCCPTCHVRHACHPQLHIATPAVQRAGCAALRRWHRRCLTHWRRGVT